MRDNRNLVIAVLSITAVVLLVGILVSDPDRALAIGQLDRGGDYIMLTGQFSDSSELLYITDAAARRLNVYGYNSTNRQFVLWDSIDLTRLVGKKRGK
ncbi:MAG: hypothetical protein ACE5EC_00245 [Phycisphaerae bacterium]